MSHSRVNRSSADEQPARAPNASASAARTPADSARKGRWWWAPVRWLRRAVRAVLRPVRALARSPFRLAKTIFMATIGRDRGFGFWWLVATIALAAIIGLVLAVVLSPVLGLIAAIGVAAWMLFRRRRSARSGEQVGAEA